MAQGKKRTYNSPIREKRALSTRARILAAAKGLLVQKGFAGMSVADLARQAGVSPQTVYAAFASKAGIIKAIIEARILDDPANTDILKNILSGNDPHLVLRSVAKLVRKIHDQHAVDFTILYGTALISPEAAALEKAIEELRLEKQCPLIRTLMASGAILPHLDESVALDILWTLTSRQLYHLLVTCRNWSSDQYEAYLYTLLTSSLIRQDAPPPPGGDGYSLTGFIASGVCPSARQCPQPAYRPSPCWLCRAVPP